MTEEEIKDDFLRSMDAWDKHKRKRALRALFEKDSIDYSITDFKYHIRVFCWLKTLICLLLNRTKGSYLDDDKFCILSYDESSCGESIGWETCWVSHCIVKDWNVCLTSDGN